MRVLSLHNGETGKEEKVCYIHADASGNPLVNSEKVGLFLRSAGDPLSPGVKDKNYVITLSSGLDLSEKTYLSVSDGEVLFRFDPQKGWAVINPGFVGVSFPVFQWRPIRAGVLTVSDKGSRGEREDMTGPLLEDLISALGAEIDVRRIVPDDQALIAETLSEWSDEQGLHFIATNGGTGFSLRDVTPEALLAVGTRLVPGIGEAMRSRTLAQTPRAMLTRGLAVIRGKTLIVAFPGSERGARQCFEAVAPALRHGIEILQGWATECGSHAHHHRE